MAVVVLAGVGCLRRNHLKPARDAGPVEDRYRTRTFRLASVSCPCFSMATLNFWLGFPLDLTTGRPLSSAFLSERKFLRSVEEATADAGRRPDRELVVEQEEGIPGGRDLREVVEQGGGARLGRVVVRVDEVHVVGTERVRALRHRYALVACVGHADEAAAKRPAAGFGGRRYDLREDPVPAVAVVEEARGVSAAAPSPAGEAHEGVARDRRRQAIQVLVEDQDLTDVVGLDHVPVTGAQTLVRGFDVAQRVGGQRAAVDRVQALHADRAAGRSC